MDELEIAAPVAAGVPSRGSGVESSLSMEQPDRGDLWAVERHISTVSQRSERISEREILHFDVFVCDGRPGAKLCEIRAREAHVKNMGGVPMKTYF